MSFKNSLRDRAIAAFRKANPNTENFNVRKRRSTKTIVIRAAYKPGFFGEAWAEWSYKNGGKLEKVVR